MKIGVIAENETLHTKKLVEAINQQKATGIFQSIAEIGLGVKNNKPFLVGARDFFTKLEGVFFQLPPSFMAFMEPLLSEIAGHGIFSPIETESFFLLSNEPYLFHVLNRKGVPIPQTTVFADPNNIPNNSHNFDLPCIVTAYHGAQRIQNTRCENISSLQSIIKSLPESLDCVMVREQPVGAKVTSIVIGETVFSSEFPFNSQKNEFSKKGHLIKLGENETDNIIQASRSIGVEIATIETIGGKIMGVSSMVELEEMSQTTSQNLFGLVAKYIAERCGGE